MASSSPAPRPPPAISVGDVQEILRSPPSSSIPLIADEDVSSGAYRRPSLPSPTAPFQNVTACSPLGSPEEEVSRTEASQRGGRRQMLRSGTSGSITPLSVHSSEPSFSRQNSTTSSVSTSSSNAALPTATATASGNHVTGADSQQEHSPVQLSAEPRAAGDVAQQPSNARAAQIAASLRRKATESAASSSAARTGGLLSVFVSPTAEEIFRSPSQMSTVSEAESYFTARPASPVDHTDVLSLPLLRSHSSKSHGSLRRDRVSSSGRSYATCVSDYGDDDLVTATAHSLSIDDEACFVDSDHTLPSLHHANGKKGVVRSRTKRIDFLSALPPELSLCIVFLLEEHVDLLAVSLVSKRWRGLAMDQSVWRHLFFSQPGWAIREDAPLVLQHQAELQRIQAEAKRTAAREEAERLRRLQEQRKAASTSSPYLDRLAALKSWRETLHIPSFPHLAGLSLPSTGSATEVDVDSGRRVTSPMGAPMSPLRSPTAATGRFGLFLSPAKPVPSTPAGAKRAQEAAATSYFAQNEASSATVSRQESTSSIGGTSRRQSIDSNFAEVAEAEEFFAASLNWTRLYRDRYLLEQRWMRGHASRKGEVFAGNSSLQTGGGMSRTALASSANEAAPIPASSPGGSRAYKERRQFEPTKRFLRGHQDSVYCIRQDDGVGTGTAGKLVSGSRDRTIRVWDVETGACKHILQGHTASVLSLQYDDQILVSVSSDGQGFVWDFASILAAPKPPSRPPADCSAGEPSVPSVDAASGALIHGKADRVLCVLRDHTSAVLDVAFDAQWIVTGSKDATVRVWRRSDIVSSSVPASSPASPVAWRKFSHTGPVNAVDLQGGQVVSASGEGSMYLWDLHTGEKVHKFSGHTKGLACIVFKGTTLVSGSNDQTIRVWDTVNGKCTHVLGEHHMLVRTVAYCPIRRLVVSGGYDRVIKLWHIDSPAAVQGVKAEQEWRGTGVIQEARDGGAGSQHGDSRSEGEGEEEKTAWGRCLRDIKCHRARIFDVDFNTTRIVSASEDHLICITNFGGQGIDTSLFA